MSVLEPSAGTGNLVHAAHKAGAKYIVAVEANHDMAWELAQRGVGANYVEIGDFLSVAHDRWDAFDAVVMNPPFSKRRDIRHVTHALGFLRPGGRLVAVISAGVEFRADRIGREFRELIAAHDGTCERLPDGSFASSGTGVNTVLVTMRRAP